MSTEANDQEIVVDNNEANAINNADVSEVEGAKEDEGEEVRIPLNLRLIAAVGSSCFGSLCMGYVLGYSSPAIPKLERNDSGTDFTPAHRSVFGSLMTIGALLGGLIAGKVAEKLGRRMVLIATGLPFALAWVLISTSKNVLQLMTGRLFTGFFCGVVSLVVPVYIAEITPPNQRGFLGTWVQICITIGILSAFSLGLGLSWDLLALFGTVFPLLLSLTMIFQPETPRWLISHGQHDKAVKSLEKVYSTSVDASKQCKVIQESMEAMAGTKVSYAELLQQANVKPLLVSMGIMVSQQISGINIVVFYTVTIFEASGSSVEPQLATVIVGVIQVLATVVSSFLVDRTGRKLLLLFSASTMGISLFLLGLYDLLKEMELLGDGFGWLPLCCLVTFIIAFSLGYGPIPWIMMAELLPTRVRGLASGIATAVNWLLAFIVTVTFDLTVSNLHSFGAYWQYTYFCGLGLLFLYFVPETKGRTLEDIEKFFRN